MSQHGESRSNRIPPMSVELSHRRTADRESVGENLSNAITLWSASFMSICIFVCRDAFTDTKRFNWWNWLEECSCWASIVEMLFEGISIANFPFSICFFADGHFNRQLGWSANFVLLSLCNQWFEQDSRNLRDLTWHHCRFLRHFVLQIVPLPAASFIKNVIFQVFLLIAREFISRLSKTTFHILRGAARLFDSLRLQFLWSISVHSKLFRSAFLHREREKKLNRRRDINFGILLAMFREESKPTIMVSYKNSIKQQSCNDHTINCKRH